MYKKENMQITPILGWKCENFVIFFDVQELFKKDLLSVLMVKLQTVDIYLGHTRLNFFQLAWNMSRGATNAYHVIQNCHGKCKQSTFHTISKQIRW